jgi:hypothetical protein
MVETAVVDHDYFEVSPIVNEIGINRRKRRRKAALLVIGWNDHGKL